MKSITCADLRKDLFCSLEIGILEDDFRLCRPILDLILVVACVPQNLVMTEFVLLGLDKMIMLHRTIVAVLGEIVKSYNSNEINNLRHVTY